MGNQIVVKQNDFLEVGDAATRLGQVVTGISAYVGAYQDTLKNSYKDNVEKFQFTLVFL